MKRSKFSLSHYKLFTGDMGYLIPITWYEVLPGDSIQQSTALVLRVSPMLAPVMHPVRVRIHHWYVPIRKIWEDFEDFITGGDDGDDTSQPPYFDFSNDTVTESSLYDYFGVPPADYTGKTMHISALPTRAYNLIWNENYRDKDLNNEQTIDLSSGEDTTTDKSSPGAAPLSVCWEKDYFTASRPWEQKGTQLMVPIGDSAPVKGIGGQTQNYGAGANAYETDGTGSVAYAAKKITYNTADDSMYVEEDPDNSGFPNIRADLSEATGVSINELRLALGIQRFQEARAKYGSDYVEYLRSLGVRSQDGRLQRPEYLGGGRQVITFSEVLATDGSNTGSMYGHGIAAMRSNQFRRFIPEHGIVMSLMSVVPKTIYTQGLHRSFFKEVKEDYFQKELQTIGEQEVYCKEIYTESADPDEVFGYQSRYDEYRSMPSSIAGEFRSTLDHWHMARIFASEPALNGTFVKCVPTKRVLASDTTDAMYIMANHSIQARRPLMKYARAITL